MVRCQVSPIVSLRRKGLARGFTRFISYIAAGFCLQNALDDGGRHRLFEPDLQGAFTQFVTFARQQFAVGSLEHICPKAEADVAAVNRQTGEYTLVAINRYVGMPWIFGD